MQRAVSGTQTLKKIPKLRCDGFEARDQLRRDEHDRVDVRSLGMLGVEVKLVGTKLL
jgi:hypothetical protein